MKESDLEKIAAMVEGIAPHPPRAGRGRPPYSATGDEEGEVAWLLIVYFFHQIFGDEQ